MLRLKKERPPRIKAIAPLKVTKRRIPPIGIGVKISLLGGHWEWPLDPPSHHFPALRRTDPVGALENGLPFRNLITRPFGKIAYQPWALWGRPLICSPNVSWIQVEKSEDFSKAGRNPTISSPKNGGGRQDSG
jgi:hypothetical protein